MEWQGNLNSDEQSKNDAPDEIIKMFMRAYRDSTLTIIENCKDPLLKKRLTDILNKEWKQK
jgi:hypothetical protein